MAERNEDNQLPEELQDWIIAEQIFKESGLEQDADTAAHNDFLRNLHSVGAYLASLSTPNVQFAQINDGQILLAFDHTEPVDLETPFFPVDEEGQLWALHHQDVEKLETPTIEPSQISALTAYGYNHNNKMMLFNLQEQRILSINAAPAFAQAMVRALAVEHAMEPWNTHRRVYLIGFGEFGAALKYNLDPYHGGVEVVEALTDLAHDFETLNNSTIFAIGQDASTVSEFIRTTQGFNLGVVADVPIGGGFIYYQETEDRGALEPGNLTIFPFLMGEESDDYQAVENNYAKHLDTQAYSIPEAKTSSNEETADVSQTSDTPQATEPDTLTSAPSSKEQEAEEDFTITDEDLQQLLNSAPVESSEPQEPATATPEPAAEETDTVTAHLKLMGESAPMLVSENGTIGGFPAEVIAYTYLQQHYGDTKPTFADLCTRLWGEPATGSNKSKFSARRKRAKEKLSDLIPDAEFTTERDGWRILNLTTDIDLIPDVPVEEPLKKSAWAKDYLPALQEKIAAKTRASEKHKD